MSGPGDTTGNKTKQDPCTPASYPLGGKQILGKETDNQPESFRRWSLLWREPRRNVTWRSGTAGVQQAHHDRVAGTRAQRSQDHSLVATYPSPHWSQVTFLQPSGLEMGTQMRKEKNYSFNTVWHRWIKPDKKEIWGWAQAQEGWKVV